MFSKIPFRTTDSLRPVWNIVAGAYSVGRATELYSILVMPIYLGWPVTAGLFGAMHVIYTILIAARTIVLARASGRPRPTLGSIIVESALPYGIVSLVFMILYCAGVMAANCLIPLLVQLQVSYVRRLHSRLRATHLSSVHTGYSR